MLEERKRMVEDLVARGYIKTEKVEKGHGKRFQGKSSYPQSIE